MLVMFTYDARCDVGDVQLPFSVSGREGILRVNSEKCRQGDETHKDQLANVLIASS